MKRIHYTILQLISFISLMKTEMVLEMTVRRFPRVLHPEQNMSFWDRIVMIRTVPSLLILSMNAMVLTTIVMEISMKVI